MRTECRKYELGASRASDSSSQWATGNKEPDDAYANGRDGLNHCAGGVRWGAVAARRAGSRRPQVFRGGALLHGPQHHLAALPTEFGQKDSIWKRFWRLSRAVVFEALFQALAECRRTARLVQISDSTVVRAHQHSAGAQKKLVRTAPARTRQSGAPAAA